MIESDKLLWRRMDAAISQGPMSVDLWRATGADLDAFALTRTKRWKSPEMAERYTHTKPSADAMKAELLPSPQRKAG